MKAAILLIASLFTAILAFPQTKVLSSGKLTPDNETSATRTVEKVTLPEDEGIISEDRIWQYIDIEEGHGYGDEIILQAFRFKGITEKNGQTYHNLYLKSKRLEEQEVTDENILGQIEFDFDSLKPSFYIRQEGQKYYMLTAEDYKSLGTGRVEYGSPEIETLIYDFSLTEGESFELCTAKSAPYTFPEAYNWDYQYTIDHYGEIPEEEFNQRYMSDKVTFRSVKNYRFGDVTLPLYDYWGLIQDNVSPKYGSLLYYAVLPMPYTYNHWVGCPSKFSGINNIYDTEGNIILQGINYKAGKGYTELYPVGIKEAAEDSLNISFNNGLLRIGEASGKINAGIYDLMGRTVWRGEADGHLEEQIPNLQRGVYILDVLTDSEHISRKFIF